ncbi:MAG: hypothetical protein COA99_16740 [Moraxellaceae bacterium]|nr:MAG: hypothetical protein COA99_16740 [Moraxellaceae bacterium]
MPSDHNSDNIHILLVDDHPVFMEGVASILSNIFPKLCLERACTVEDAYQTAISHPSLDWILLDYHLPGATGLDLVRKFNDAFITSPVILITADENIGIVHEALELGVNGFISKMSTTSVYAQCFQRIEHGDTFITPDTTTALDIYRNSSLQEKSHVLKHLRPRQMEMLHLISQGYSNDEISNSLGIAISTVKTHISSLMGILAADNRSHCVAEARRLGIIDS